MKHILLSLKRFDIPREYGGVNGVAPMEEWGSYTAQNIQKKLKAHGAEDMESAIYFPEAHLIPTIRTLCEDSPVGTGRQGMYGDDMAGNGNFGTFATNHIVNAAKVIRCSSVITSHCEERKDKAGILREARVTDEGAVEGPLNQEVKAAIRVDFTTLYCVGEMDGEQEQWQEVLGSQLRTGLKDVDKEKVVIAYEPIQAIGPGKIPSGGVYITKIGSYTKEMTGGVDVVYGDGLKADNTRTLVPVSVMGGDLITLTRFRGEIGFYPEEYPEIVRTYLGQD